ncbi:P pilus assembly protein, chaperone PapD [Kosakonia sacchari]|nr:P pilus assembly protein, chaperone PapD [Kosakonia sacchari]
MRKHVKTVALAALWAVAFSSHAGLIASSTRVIFKEGQTQQSLMLVNTNSWPVMAQSWVDNGNTNVTMPDRIKTPFVAVPALFKLEPQAMQGLRLIYNQQELPQDRESVFWLNLYEIPPKSSTISPQAQSVVLTMNTQMKIFWRPKKIGDPENIAEKISFHQEKNGKDIEIVCHNASPWHVSFAGISLLAGGKTYAAGQQPDMMVSPFSEKHYFVEAANLARNLPLRVKAELIDDLGQVTAREFPLQ